MLYRYGPFGLHGGVFGWLFFVLIVTAVALLVISVARSWRTGPAHPFSRGPWQPHPGFDPALTALRVSYARGEITWEEFVRRAANLGYPATPGAPPGGPPPGGPPTGATVATSATRETPGAPPPSP